MKANTCVQATGPQSRRWLPQDISTLQTHDSPGQEEKAGDEARQFMEGLIHDVLNTLQCISIALDCLSLAQPAPSEEYQFIFRQLEHASRLLREGRDHFCRPTPQVVGGLPAAALVK